MLKVKMWCIALCLGTRILGAQSWSAAMQISDTSQTASDVSLCYNPSINATFAAWHDNMSGLPMFSIYRNGMWSPADQINPGASSGVLIDVSLGFDSKTNMMVAAWGNAGDNLPYYSTYDGTNWLPNAQLISNTSEVADDVLLSFYPKTNVMVATWQDKISGNPFYSTFDGTSWSFPLQIDGTLIVLNDVSVSYDSLTNTMIAAWVDFFSNLPYFSIYDGTNWTPGDTISTGMDSMGALFDVALSYDPATSSMIAAWGSQLSSRQPFFSTYNGTLPWSTEMPIPNSSGGASEDVLLAYEPVTNTMFAAWGNAGDNLPTFSTFSNGMWSAAKTMTPGTVFANVALSYDTISHSMIAAWNENVATNFPTFSVSVGPPPPPPSPPSPSQNLPLETFLYNVDRIRPIYNTELQAAENALRNAGLIQ